jgi:hypothetical protein
MGFTFTETFGEKPFTEWVVKKLEDNALQKHGLEVRVTISPKYKFDQETSTFRAPDVE